MHWLLEMYYSVFSLCIMINGINDDHITYNEWDDLNKWGMGHVAVMNHLTLYKKENLPFWKSNMTS